MMVDELTLRQVLDYRGPADAATRR